MPPADDVPDEPIVRYDVGVGPWPGPLPDDSVYDPELLAEGDRRNVADRYRYWRHDAIVADLDTRRHPFHVAIENWQHDFNIGSVVRTANAFLAAEVHIVGRRRWNRRGAMVTDRYQHVRHHDSVQAFADWCGQADLPMLGVDNLPGAVPIENASFPRRVRARLRPGRPGSDRRHAGRLRDDVVDRAVRLDPVDQRRRRGRDCDAHVDPPARVARRRGLTTPSVIRARLPGAVATPPQRRNTE